MDAHLSTCEVSKIPIFFIVGRGRSGTTLLQMLLDACPNVIVPIESKFVLHLYRKYDDIEWTRNSLARLIGDLYTNRKFRLFWNLDPESLQRYLESNLPIDSFATICKLIYLRYQTPFHKKSIKWIGDKNPYYSLFIPQLMDLFEECKFIHVVRDGRATVSSHLRALGKTNVVHLALQWRKYNCHIERSKKAWPERFLTIRYEDLIKDPDYELQRVSGFLCVNIGSDVQMKILDKSDWIRDHLYLGLVHHQGISKPIDIKKIHSWREDLSPSQIRLIEWATNKELTHYGFKTTSTPGVEFTQVPRVLAGYVMFYVHHILVDFLPFRLPFFIRKKLLKVISMLFDRKYADVTTADESSIPF